LYHAILGLAVNFSYVVITMGAEFLADLRGIIGGLGTYAVNPYILFAVVLAIYLIYRKSSS
jgi:hypothetical protein